VCQVLQDFTYDVGYLCSGQGANLNLWSNFAPGYIGVDGSGNIRRILPSPGDWHFLDDFLGYNHNAPTPRIEFLTSNINYYDGLTSVNYNGSFYPGEIDWTAIKDVNGNDISGIDGFFYEIYINGSKWTTQFKQMDFANSHDAQAISMTIPVTWPNNYTVTVKFGLATNTATNPKTVGYISLPTGDIQLTITPTGVLNSANLSVTPESLGRFTISAKGYDETGAELTSGLTYQWTYTGGSFQSGTDTSQTRLYHPPSTGSATVTVAVTQTSSGRTYNASITFTDGQLPM
jgi:hypothetical protein